MAIIVTFSAKEDESSDTVNICNLLYIVLVKAVRLLIHISRFHTRGRTNRLDGQIVWHLFVWCEFEKAICRKVVRLKFALPEEYEHKSVHLSAKRTGTRFKLCCKSKMAATLHMYSKRFSGRKRLLGEDFWCRRSMVTKYQLLESESSAIPVCAAVAALGATRGDEKARSPNEERNQQWWDDGFFLSSAMLKLPIKPRSVASPISSRRENQPFDRLMWI